MRIAVAGCTAEQVLGTVILVLGVLVAKVRRSMKPGELPSGYD